MSKPGRSGTSTLSTSGVMGTITHTNDYLCYETADGDPYTLKGRRRSSQTSIGSECPTTNSVPTLPPNAQTAPEYASVKLMGAVEGALTEMLDQMPENNHVVTLASFMRAYGEQAMGSAQTGYAKRMIPVEMPIEALKRSYAEKIRQQFEPPEETSIIFGSGSSELSRNSSAETLSVESGDERRSSINIHVPGLTLPGQTDKLKLNILLEPRSQQKAGLQNDKDSPSGSLRRLSSGALQKKLVELANMDELNMSLRPTTDIRPLPTNCTRAGRLPLFGLHCPHINDIEQTCKHLYDEGFRKHVTILFCLEDETVFIDGVPHVGNKWRSTCQEYGTKIPFAPFEEALQNAILDSDISNESTATGMKTFANCDTLNDVVEHVSLKCKVQRIACTRLAIPNINEHPHPFLSMDLVDALNVIADKFVVSQSPEAALIVCSFSASPLPGGLVQSCLGTALYAHSDRFTVYTLGKQPDADTFHNTLQAHEEVLESRASRDAQRDIITANLRRMLTADDTPPEKRKDIQERIKQMHEAELRRITRREEEDQILLSQIRRKEIKTMMGIQAMARGLVVRFRRRQEKKLEAKKAAEALELEMAAMASSAALASPPAQPKQLSLPGARPNATFNKIVSPPSKALMSPLNSPAAHTSSILADSSIIVTSSSTFKIEGDSAPVQVGRRRRRVTMGEDSADSPQAASPEAAVPLGKIKTSTSPTAIKDALTDLKAEKAKTEEVNLPPAPIHHIDPKIRYRNEALYAPLRHIIHELYTAYDSIIAIDPPYRGKSITKKVSVWSHRLTRIEPATQDDISSEDEDIEVNQVDIFTPAALKSLKPVKVSIGTGMALNRQHKDVVDPHRIVMNMMRDCNCDQRGFLFSVFSSFAGSSLLQKKGYRTIRDISILLLNSIYAILVSTEHRSVKGHKSLSSWLATQHAITLSKLMQPDLVAIMTPVGGVPRISRVGPCEMDVKGHLGVGWAIVAAKQPVGAPLPWMTLQQTEAANSKVESNQTSHSINFHTFLTDGCISARTARSQHVSEWWYTHFVSEEAQSLDVIKTSTSFFHRSIPVFAFYEPLPVPKWQEVANKMPYYSSCKWISTTRNFILYIDDIPYALVRRGLDGKLVPPTARIRPHTPPRPKTPPVRISPRRQSSHHLNQKLEPKPPSEHRTLGRSNSGVHLPTTASIARMASTLGSRMGSFRSNSKTAHNPTPIGKRRKKQDSDSSGEEEVTALEDVSDLTGFNNRALHHNADIFSERNADITLSEEQWLSQVSWVEAEVRFAAQLIKATPRESGLFPAFEPATCGDAQTNPHAYTLEGCNLSETVIRVAHPPTPPKLEKPDPVPSFGLARRRTQRLNVEIVAPESNTPEPIITQMAINGSEPVPIAVRSYSTAIKETILKKSPVDAHFLRCPIIPGTANFVHSFSAVIQEVRTATSSAAIGVGLDTRDNVIVLGIALVASCHEKGLCDVIVDEVKELMMPPTQSAAVAAGAAVSFGDEGRNNNGANSLLHTRSMRMPHTMKVLPFIQLIGQLFADDFEVIGIDWEESVTFVDSLLTRTGLYPQLRQPVDDLLAFNEEVRLGNIHVTERHERLAVRRRIVEALRTAEGYLFLLLTHAFLSSRWLRRNAEATFVTFVKEVPLAQNIIRNFDIFAGTNQPFKNVLSENDAAETPMSTFIDLDSVNKVGALPLDSTTGPEGAADSDDVGFGDIGKSLRHRDVGFLVDPHHGSYSGWDLRWVGTEGYVHTIQ